MHLGHERLGFLVSWLDHAHADQAHPEEFAHFADALAVHVHHGHAAQDLQDFWVLGDLHHACEGADSCGFLAAARWANIHVHVELGFGQVVVHLHLAGVLVNHGLHEFDLIWGFVGCDDLHFSAVLDVDLFGH